MIRALPAYVILSLIAGVIIGITVSGFLTGLMVWIGSFYVLIIAHIIMSNKQKENKL